MERQCRSGSAGGRRCRALAAAAVMAVVGFAFGCSGDDLRSLSGSSMTASLQSAQQPASITLVSGDGQVGLAGSTLAQPLVLLVRDGAGNGIPGAAVLMTITAGPATLSVEQGVTNTAGQIQATVKLVAPGAIAGAAAVAGSTGIAPATFSATALEAGQLFSGAGGAAAVTAFQSLVSAIGGADNGAEPPPLETGRRQIDWESVLLNGTDFSGNSTVIVAGSTVGIPTQRFQARGLLLDRVAAVSGDGFASVNPGVPGAFPPFSPSRRFAPFGVDNRVTASFVRASVPSTAPAAARASAFGAVFVDVEKPSTSSIEYFAGANSLGKFFVPVGASGQPAFVGVKFAATAITHVVLTAGDATLFKIAEGAVTAGPADLSSGGTADQVALDDLVYSEPQL